LRLWLRQHDAAILLVPLVTWAAPANRDDSVFLEPSLGYCARHLEWTPDIVVGDLAYLGIAAQRRLREKLQVALVTKFRSDMVLPDEFDDAFTMSCEQGQVLQWLGLHEADQLHWFGVTDPDPLCTVCWQRSACPQEFSFKPANTRSSTAQFLTARGWDNNFCGRHVRGLKPVSPMRKTNLG